MESFVFLVTSTVNDRFVKESLYTQTDIRLYSSQFFKSCKIVLLVIAFYFFRKKRKVN